MFEHFNAIWLERRLDKHLWNSILNILERFKAEIS